MALFLYLDYFVIVFMNDILVYSNKEANHVRYLSVLHQRLRDENFYAEFSMCEIWLDSLSFLGHVVTKDGILVDLTKVTIVYYYDRLTCPIILWRFIGSAGYHCRFMKGFSSIMSSLTKLTNQKIVFQWLDDYERSF